jgi:DNA-binding LytR/AlgR family response regulator
MKLPSLRQLGFIALASAILGHFFISLGRTESLFQLFDQSWYWLDLLFVGLITFVEILYIAIAHYTLDVRSPLSVNLPLRFAIQAMLGVVVPAALAFILTYIYMEFVLDQDLWSTTFIVYEYPISLVVILTINLVFIVVSLLKTRLNDNAVEAGAQSSKEIRSVLMLTQGDRAISVSVSDIASVSKEGDYAIITTFNQQQYVSSETLEDLIKGLPPDLFFRANRQWIIHRLSCGHFTTERSGKIELLLKEPISRSITVSQKRGKEFRTWLQA